MKLISLLLLLCFSTYIFSQNTHEHVDYTDARLKELFIEEFDDNGQAWTDIQYDYDGGENVEYYLESGLAHLISDDRDFPAIKLLSSFGYNKHENYLIESSFIHLGEDENAANYILWGAGPSLETGYRMGYNGLGQVQVQELVDGIWQDLLVWTDNSKVDIHDYNILSIQRIEGEYNLFINDHNFFNFDAPKLAEDHDVTGFMSHGDELGVDDLYMYKVILPEATNEVGVGIAKTTEPETIPQKPTPNQPNVSDTRGGLKVIKEDNESTDVLGNYYALIIGVQDYSHNSITDLKFPIRDAQNFKDVLESKYGFLPKNIRFLKNPTRSEVYKSFNHLRHMVTKNDNVIIFYAGHGFYDEKVKEGYWLPSNAEQGDDSGWIANSGLRTKIDAIHSKHTLLISDACFGGSIFKPSRSAFADAGRSIVQSYEKNSRKGMTSGTLKTVPDESVFMKYLLKALKENNRKYLTASALFYSFNEAVGNNSYNTPQFGVLFQVGDEGGQFVFINEGGTVNGN